MGSTNSRHTHATINPAANLVQKGNFAQARKELLELRSSVSNLDVIVLLAVCEYRLGNMTALTRLRQTVGSKLTAEHEAQLLRHELIGLIKDQQFDAAHRVLDRKQLSTSERGSLTLLQEALRVLRLGQDSATLKWRPGKFGIVTPREVRSQYLPMAKLHCTSVAVAMRKFGGSAAEPMLVMALYMSLLIEMSMSSDMRDSANIRQLREELSTVDEDFRKALPSKFQPTKFCHRF